jgi:hypothetical protein
MVDLRVLKSAVWGGNIFGVVILVCTDRKAHPGGEAPFSVCGVEAQG